MYDPHHPENQHPSRPPWPPAPTNGAPTGPPAEPFPQLPTGRPPAPPDPARGARPWILAAIGLTLVAVITWGSIALWGGDDTATIKPGTEQPTAAPGDDQPTPPVEDPTTPPTTVEGKYATPDRACDLVDLDRLERQYGAIYGDPTETIEENTTRDAGRHELVFCQAIFGAPGEVQTRVIVAVVILHDAAAESPTEPGQSIKDTAGATFERVFLQGCGDRVDFGGDWESGQIGTGGGCYLADGNPTSTIVVKDDNAVFTTQVTTTDTGRHQEAITQEAKRTTQYAVEQARQPETTGN